MATYNADGTSDYVPGESNDRAVSDGVKAAEGAEPGGIVPPHVATPTATPHPTTTKHPPQK